MKNPIAGGGAVALFEMVVIPIVILAIGIGAVALAFVSRREVPELVHDAERRFDRHRRAHPVRYRGETKSSP